MKLFDSHCHLQLPHYDADRAEVIARMQQGEVGAVLIGVDLATSRSALELAKQHNFLWAAVGLHPNDPEEKTTSSNGAGNWIEGFETLAKDPKVVAIGECGLDYFRSGGTDEERAAQKSRFIKQAALAQKVGKALIIHCRNAHDDMLAVLGELELSIPVVIHFFTGSGELAQKYLDLGCYLSFPGPVTYTDMYDTSIRVCPLEKMLIETDSPFAAPVPFRGKRNEPMYVEQVAAKVAQIKGLLPSEVEAVSVTNARKVFGLSPKENRIAVLSK